MGIKSDKWITKRAQSQNMIEPFVSKGKEDGIISYGLSSYGYDLRIADEYKIFTNVYNSIIDPKNFDKNTFVDFTGDSCIIPPNSFVLGRSYEYIRMPRDVLGICIGKSTYARCGLIVNVTPLEPEWEGYLTIEISNTTQLPTIIYSNEGICQLIFVGSSIGFAHKDRIMNMKDVCRFSYKDKDGKYQKQIGVTPPKIKGSK